MLINLHATLVWGSCSSVQAAILTDSNAGLVTKEVSRKRRDQNCLPISYPDQFAAADGPPLLQYPTKQKKLENTEAVQTEGRWLECPNSPRQRTHHSLISSLNDDDDDFWKIWTSTKVKSSFQNYQRKEMI